MAKTASNTSVLAEANKEISQRANARRDLRLRYEKEEKVSTSVSPLYKPYFGNVMSVCVNGITIRFPIDGSVHKIPATFSAEIRSRVMAIDASNEKATRMADVKSNAESYPGELKMF